MYALFSLPNSNLGPALHPPRVEEQNKHGVVVTAAGNSPHSGREARGRFRCAAIASMISSVRMHLHIWLSTYMSLPCPKRAHSLRHFSLHARVALGGPRTAHSACQLPCPMKLQQPVSSGLGVVWFDPTSRPILLYCL